MPHDWFANLTGFREDSYDLTRGRLIVDGDELVSTVNDKRYGIGSLEKERDDLLGQLAIGLHRDVQVTDVLDDPRRAVSQAFCSALPVAYGSGRPSEWEAFARLVFGLAVASVLIRSMDRVG